MVPERFAPSVRLTPAFQSYYLTVLLPESFVGVAPSAPILLDSPVNYYFQLILIKSQLD